MYLGTAARRRQRKAAREPAQDLVPQSRKGQHEQRLRGHLPPEAAAAGIPVAAGGRMVAGLSMPCAAEGNAHQADRHRALQIRRVPAQRGGQDRAQPGLLEAGAALCRRYRVADHAGQCDAQPGVHRRHSRHRLAIRHHRTAAAGRHEPGAAGAVRADLHQCQPQPDP